MQPCSGILITGIGCVGKSSLRHRVAEAFSDRVVCVDRDDALPEPKVAPGQVLVVESVHGLEEQPERWGLVIYLLPPPGHVLRWLRRGLIWFRTGKVDRPPQAMRNAWSLLNIPLIVQLVAKNIWNSKRWVEQDLKHITELSYKDILVTNDSEKAFSKIRQLIERTNMVTGNNEDKLKKWIRDSIELDLVYDEENYNEANGWGLKSVQKAKELIENNDSADLFNSPDNSRFPNSYYSYFLSLKKSRVFYDLEYDKARNAFTDQNPEIEYKSEYKYVCDVADLRRKLLNVIMWRCAAAISELRSQENDMERATLIAIFHSELCASAYPEISLGQASTFRSTVTKEAVGYSVFKWLSHHNLARGYSHIHLNLEALKYIDTFVDDFPNKVKKLEKYICCKENLLYRWLFFPASRTLAQSLHDLGRHSEQRYYLEQALNKAKNLDNDYWQKRLVLDLELERRDSEISLNIYKTFKSLENGKNLPARLEEALRTVQSSCPLLVTNKIQDEDDEIKKWDVWKESEKWIIWWHSGVPHEFGHHLETIAKTISEMLNNRPNGLAEKLSDKALQSIIEVLDEVYKSIELFRQNEKKTYVYYLIYDMDNKNLSQNELVPLWEQGSALFTAIRDVLDFVTSAQERGETVNIHTDNLKRYHNRKSSLENPLKKSVFDKYRSQARNAEVLKEDQKPKYFDEGECPLHKSRKGKCERTCAIIAFPKSVEMSSSQKKNHLVEYSHYKRIMDTQQKRFMNYLTISNRK